MDLTVNRGRCIRRFAMIAKKSAKSLLSPAEAVRFTARIAFPSAKTAVVKKAIKQIKANKKDGSFRAGRFFLEFTYIQEPPPILEPSFLPKYRCPALFLMIR